jgi:hypothetical protein
MLITSALLRFPAQQLVAAIALVALLGGCTSFPDSSRRGEVPSPTGRQTAPENPQVQALLGQVYGQLAADDLAGAEDVLLHAARIEPRNPWVALNLGVVYQRTGRTAQARSEYRKVLSTDGPMTNVALASDNAWQKSSPADVARHNLNLLKQEEKTTQAAPIGRPQAAVAAVVLPVSETSKYQQSTTPAEKELLGTLETWRAAWAARDINAYLANYAENFRPVQGERAAWAADRRRIIAAAGTINLQLESPQVRFSSDKQAVIVFRQRYRTATVSDVGTKKLTLQRNGDRWLIQQETFAAEAR